MVEALTEILRPRKGSADVVFRQDFQKLVALYLCSAKEDEEGTCTRFIAGVTGGCCFKVTESNLSLCNAPEVKS